MSEEQVKFEGREVILSESDKQFLRDLKDLLNPTNELRNQTGDNFHEENCLYVKSSKKQDTDFVLEQLKKILEIDYLNNNEVDKMGVIPWQNSITLYKNKKGEKIYLEDKKGKIYEYSQSPRHLPIKKK